MADEININQVLGEVGDTRPVRSDGPINVSQGSGISLSYGSVAGAGSTTTDATVTSYHRTIISSTVASGGIRFDSFGAGDSKSVKNYASATVVVYPPTGGTVNNGAANAGFSLTSGTGAAFFANGASTLFTVS